MRMTAVLAFMGFLSPGLTVDRGVRIYSLP